MKKKLLSLLTTLAMVAGLSAGIFSTGIIEANASGGNDTEYYGDWAYYVMYSSEEHTAGTGSVYITAYLGSDSSVTIPSEINGETVKYVDSLSSDPDVLAFNSTLTTITIPSTIEYVMCLFCCENLTTIEVSDSNEYLSVSDGVLYNKDQTTLITYPSGKTGSSFTVPSTVTVIEENAFYNCSDLTSVTIPDSVTSIYDYAFYDCDNLVIYCYAGSSAEQYAIDYGIDYVLMYYDLEDGMGDLNNDGKITTADVGLANSHAKGVKLLSDELIEIADMNGDGKVTTADVGIINAYAKGTR